MYLADHLYSNLVDRYRIGSIGITLLTSSVASDIER